MRRAVARRSRFYGANPAHPLVQLGCFALAAYSVSHLAENPNLSRMILWFAVAVIGHDLVMFPGYALADRILTASSGALSRSRFRLPVSPVNYVRLPVLGSGLLFALFFPGIIEQGSVWYRAATGQTQEPFSGRWLFVTAVMFAAAAVAYVLRLGHVLARRSMRTRETSRGRGTGGVAAPDDE